MSSFAHSNGQHHAQPALQVSGPNRSAHLDLLVPTRSSSLDNPRKRRLPVYSPLPSPNYTSTSFPIGVTSSHGHHKERVASDDLETVVSANSPRYRTSVGSDRTLFHKPATDTNQGAHSIAAPFHEDMPIRPEVMSHGELVELTRALYLDGVHVRRLAAVQLVQQAHKLKAQADELSSGAGQCGKCAANQGCGPAERDSGYGEVCRGDTRLEIGGSLSDCE